LNGRATAVAPFETTFLTDVIIFFADLALDEATDNIEGDERHETPLGAMLNGPGDLKNYSYSEYVLYVGRIKLWQQLKF
jgi:hypothetical protein